MATRFSYLRWSPVFTARLFSQSITGWLILLDLVAHTSTVAGAATSVTNTQMALEELRSQLGTLTEQMAKHRNEIVEVQKIDPVLEATLKVSIENLTKRIEGLEKKQLEKWDVALVLIQVLGAIGVTLGIAFGMLKYLSGN
jgi:septal ring factor EnvC (AmiA/AmiB activator)